MRPSTFIAFIGFVLLIAGTYCPLLHFPLLPGFDVYDLSLPYGITLLLVFVVGITGTVFNRPKITRMAAMLSLLLLIVFYVALIFKLNTTFSFIPFKSISGYLSGEVKAVTKFKWGWYVLITGQVMALAGVFGQSKKVSAFN